MTAYIQLPVEDRPGGLVLETAVCEVDTQGRVRRWGAAARRVFGHTEAEAVGFVLPMVPFDLRDETIAQLERAAAGEASGEHTTVWCRADGAPLLRPVGRKETRARRGDDVAATRRRLRDDTAPRCLTFAS